MTEKVLPKVRFIRAWRHYRVGDVIQPDSAMARNFMLVNGMVELHEPEAELPNLGDPYPATDPVADRKEQRNKRGRGNAAHDHGGAEHRTAHNR